MLGRYHGYSVFFRSDLAYPGSEYVDAAGSGDGISGLFYLGYSQVLRGV